MPRARGRRYSAAVWKVERWATRSRTSSAAHFVLEIAPLVQVEGQGVAAGESTQRGPQAWRKVGQGAEGPVDVEPEALFGAQIGERLQIVDGAGVDGARVADDADRSHAGLAILPDGGTQRRDIDPPVRAHRHSREPTPAEAQQVAALLRPTVGLAGAVDPEAPVVRQAVLAHVEAGIRRAGHGEPSEVRDRGPAHEQAAGGGRVAHQLRQPSDNPTLHLRGALVVAAHVGVHRRGQQVGQHALGGAGAHDPAPEPGVHVAGAVGQDRPAELVVYRGQGGRLARDRLAELGAGRRTQGPPGRAVAHVAERRQRVVQGLMGDPRELVPVLGVEGDFAPRVVHALQARLSPRGRLARRERFGMARMLAAILPAGLAPPVAVPMTPTVRPCPRPARRVAARGPAHRPAHQRVPSRSLLIHRASRPPLRHPDPPRRGILRRAVSLPAERVLPRAGRARATARRSAPGPPGQDRRAQRRGGDRRPAASRLRPCGSVFDDVKQLTSPRVVSTALRMGRELRIRTRPPPCPSRGWCSSCWAP